MIDRCSVTPEVAGSSPVAPATRLSCNSRVCDRLARSRALLGRHINATTSRARIEQSTLIDDRPICQSTDSSGVADGWAGLPRRNRALTLTPTGPPGRGLMSPIWRSACQEVWVIGHCLVGVDGGVCVVAAGGAVRASAGSRRVVMLIFGGWPKTFVRRTSAVYCRARPPGGRGAQATNRGVVCASRGCSGRLASRNGC